jgi:Tol biopolymer transport system component
MFDRSGRAVQTVREPAGYNSMRLSRDGRQLLFDRTDPRTTSLDIFLLETDRGAETQLTSRVGTEAYPVWGLDGNIIYMAAEGTAPRLTRRHLNSTTDAPIGPEAGGLQQPSDVSPDGQWLLYSQRTGRGDFDLHALHLADGRVIKLLESPFTETGARFSPDGRYIAFASIEAGRSNIHLIPFQTEGPRRAASTAGGVMPRWSHDGRELFYMSFTADAAHMTSVSIQLTPSLSIGKATQLFTLPIDQRWADFVLAPEGRFLAIEHVQFAGQLPITVIANWPASLGR